MEKILACTSEQCVCGQCGLEKKLIGYDVSEVLNVKPAEYYVEVIKREKRACRQCEDQGVAMTPLPKRIIDTIVNKYTAHPPLYLNRNKSIASRLASTMHALTIFIQRPYRQATLLAKRRVQ